jgi:hypothetical protein
MFNLSAYSAASAVNGLNILMVAVRALADRHVMIYD